VTIYIHTLNGIPASFHRLTGRVEYYGVSSPVVAEYDLETINRQRRISEYRYERAHGYAPLHGYQRIEINPNERQKMTALVVSVIIAIAEVEGNPSGRPVKEKVDYSIGPLCIRPIMCREYKRITGKSMDWKLCRSYSVSMHVAYTVLSYYANRYQKRTGQLPGVRYLAKKWNPSEVYAAKVEVEFKKGGKR